MLLFFRGLVLSTLLSGLQALVLTSAQVARLDKFVIRCGRTLMRCEATDNYHCDDGTTKYKAASAAEMDLFGHGFLQSGAHGVASWFLAVRRQRPTRKCTTTGYCFWNSSH